MRYSLDKKPPYKSSLKDLRAYVMTLDKGSSGEVWADDKNIGYIERYDDEMLGRVTRKGEVGMMDRYGGPGDMGC